jgi:hypothetical protein
MDRAGTESDNNSAFGARQFRQYLPVKRFSGSSKFDFQTASPQWNSLQNSAIRPA